MADLSQTQAEDKLVTLDEQDGNCDSGKLPQQAASAAHNLNNEVSTYENGIQSGNPDPGKLDTAYENSSNIMNPSGDVDVTSGQAGSNTLTQGDVGKNQTLKGLEASKAEQNISQLESVAGVETFTDAAHVEDFTSAYKDAGEDNTSGPIHHKTAGNTDVSAANHELNKIGENVDHDIQANDASNSVGDVKDLENFDRHYEDLVSGVNQAGPQDAQSALNDFRNIQETSGIAKDSEFSAGFMGEEKQDALKDAYKNVKTAHKNDGDWDASKGVHHAKGSFEHELEKDVEKWNEDGDTSRDSAMHDRVKEIDAAMNNESVSSLKADGAGTAQALDDLEQKAADAGIHVPAADKAGNELINMDHAVGNTTTKTASKAAAELDQEIQGGASNKQNLVDADLRYKDDTQAGGFSTHAIGSDKAAIAEVNHLESVDGTTLRAEGYQSPGQAQTKQDVATDRLNDLDKIAGGAGDNADQSVKDLDSLVQNADPTADKESSLQQQSATTLKAAVSDFNSEYKDDPANNVGGGVESSINSSNSSGSIKDLETQAFGENKAQLANLW